MARSCGRGGNEQWRRNSSAAKSGEQGLGGRNQGCASRRRQIESAASDRGSGFPWQRQRGSGGDATGRRASGTAERRREQTKLDANRPQGSQRQQEWDWYKG